MARASLVVPHLTWIEIGMCRVIVERERERRTVSELGVCENASFQSVRHGAMKFAEVASD